jgi:hypothetical protein
VTRSEGHIEPIPDDVREEMEGVSWHDHPECPPVDQLALLRIPYLGFDGREHHGELVVARAVASKVTYAFAELYAAGYPIERMERVERYDADDGRSMAANNTSGFNFRLVEGERRLSQHARGLAVDINPVQNPWVRADRVQPEAGRAFLDRHVAHPALIRRPGVVTAAFDAIGWQWGGDWTRYRDYHHFAAVS